MPIAKLCTAHILTNFSLGVDRIYCHFCLAGNRGAGYNKCC